ncbi:MAG: hypothetical protein KDD83_19970, partial [Caldilineaceae bacterium]|nr:hypothetical protein [Caldilineaceae bacterium]
LLNHVLALLNGLRAGVLQNASTWLADNQEFHALIPPRDLAFTLPTKNMKISFTQFLHISGGGNAIGATSRIIG